MFERELTPPPDGRLSSSSGSPDSIFKSSTDSSSSRTLNFSPDSSKTSTVCKPVISQHFSKLVDEDSDIEWEPSFSSPLLQKKPPLLRKINRARSRLQEPPLQSHPLTPAPKASRSCKYLQSQSGLKNKENLSHTNYLLRPPPLSSPLATPPHKKLRALQINTDTVSTGLLQISTDSISSQSFTASPAVPTRVRSPLRSKKLSPRGSLFGGRRSLKASPQSAKKRPLFNPYTPDRHIKTVQRINKIKSQGFDSGCFSDVDSSWLLDVGKVRDTKNCDMDYEEINHLDLSDMSTSRYNEEFCQEAIIGSGEFGTVYKCINKLDGCVYAIKKSREPVVGKTLARVSRNEVYAEAVLGSHSHVVRYHSAWAEDGYLYIQNEFCNGGSLAEEIAIHQQRGTKFTEDELKEILRQVLNGLKYIHGLLLTHMDIKPGNVFIQYNAQLTLSPESGIDMNCSGDSSGSDNTADRITYKIGDFGHVTPMYPIREFEEGDCRYLPKEILSENYDHLSKSDIFALGLSMYQAATLTELPKNGDLWHEFRDGKLPYMNGYSFAFNNIIKNMIHSDPTVRPSAAELLTHPELCPEELRTRLELTRELHQERIKNQLLSEQLKAVQNCVDLKSFNGSVGNQIRPNTRTSRLVGLKVNRSKSLTNF